MNIYDLHVQKLLRPKILIATLHVQNQQYSLIIFTVILSSQYIFFSTKVKKSEKSKKKKKKQREPAMKININIPVTSHLLPW